MSADVEFDEFSDVEASLLTIKHLLPYLEPEPLLWKNIILNTHSALQSACVSYLTRTDGRGALQEGPDKKLEKYHEAQTKIATGELKDTNAPQRPVLRTHNLPNLLKILPVPLKVEERATYDACQTQQEKDIYQLHDFRNEFAHFKSHTWWIEKAGLPRSCTSALTLVAAIPSASGWQRYSRFPETRVAELAGHCLSELEKLKCA